MEIEQTILAADFPADGGARTLEGWGSWEQQRTRSFFSPSEQRIDNRGLVGLIRNWTLQHEMKRENGGLVGSCSCSVETKIGPWRLDADGQATLELRDGGKVIVSASAPGFAIACLDWRQQSWSGALTLVQFTAITAMGFTGNASARRC
jgi:hypothetical protein